MLSRRLFIQSAPAVAASTVGTAALAALPEPVQRSEPHTLPPPSPPTGRPFQPVVTLNGWSLPWRMNRNVKEFHLVAEPVRREMAPGMVARLWGYNGQSPGPTIEVVEGDRVRLFVTNRLPEPTSVHWHGQRLPNGMDGVTGLTQPPIAPGKTFVYEFVARRAGTFMYHPHADDMVQTAMGMMGLWITHPRSDGARARHGGALIERVDRDYAFLMAAYDIEPGSATPRVSTMLDFNLWAWNSRVFPGIAPLLARQGERVRIRIGNLTMTNHPIHLHGHEFTVTGTDGGAVPAGARWPEVTTDIGVGQMRQIEFTADEEGDWAFHCHKSHHTMNAMGHGTANLIGVAQDDLMDKLADLVPGTMPMGSSGMHEMAEMQMPLPPNTLPMMTGTGPFGAIGMGGMFSVLKVRRDLPRGSHDDPGWFQQPAGTAAYEWRGPLAEPPRAAPPADGNATPAREVEVKKPGAHGHHH